MHAQQMKTRLWSGLAAITASLAIVLLGVQAPAAAAWDDPSCYSSGFSWCMTRAIESHSSEHWVEYNVTYGHGFEVRDMDTNVVVAQGYASGTWRRVNGMYGQHYTVKAWSGTESVIGSIRNCTSGCVNH
jgi:hypothetical protein